MPDTIQVRVRLHGILRDKLPPEAKGQVEQTLPPEASIQSVIDNLGLDGHLNAAVNEVVIDDFDHSLHDGDMIEIFLPVAGG